MGSVMEHRGPVDGARVSADSRTEVLLEAPEGAEAGELWGLLEDNGYKVSWCPGPEGPPPVWCPLLDGRRCRLVESADVVVCALGLHGESCRQVARELGRLHPEAAVIVETPAAGAVQWESTPHGHVANPAPPSAQAVLEEIEAVLGRSVGERGRSGATAPPVRR